MHPIIYDVAVSIDGFISGPDGDVSGFGHDGPVVEDYAARLASYKCALMRRGTYEFGYKFGMKPGDNPYGAMRCVVVSSGLRLPAGSDVEVWRGFQRSDIEALHAQVDGPIYLCGGGTIAHSMLAQGLIDRVRLKRAPIVLGGGTRLFNGSCRANLKLEQEKSYADGYLFQDYCVEA